MLHLFIYGTSHDLEAKSVRKRILVPTGVAANNDHSKRQDLDEYFRLTSDTFEHLRIDLIRLPINFEACLEASRLQGM